MKGITESKPHKLGRIVTVIAQDPHKTGNLNTILSFSDI